MEFKSRLVKTRKQIAVKAKKAKGMKRVTIRGRKRWVMVDKKSPSAE